MKVRYGVCVLSQLDAIYTHIFEENPGAARSMIVGIRASIHLLGDFPQLGRATDVADVRRLVLGARPYIAFYSICGGEVRILRVLHGKQNTH